jgi:hypothetical protein
MLQRDGALEDLAAMTAKRDRLLSEQMKLAVEAGEIVESLDNSVRFGHGYKHGDKKRVRVFQENLDAIKSRPSEEALAATDTKMNDEH